MSSETERVEVLNPESANTLDKYTNLKRKYIAINKRSFIYALDLISLVASLKKIKTKINKNLRYNILQNNSNRIKFYDRISREIQLIIITLTNNSNNLQVRAKE